MRSKKFAFELKVRVLNYPLDMRPPAPAEKNSRGDLSHMHRKLKRHRRVQIELSRPETAGKKEGSAQGDRFVSLGHFPQNMGGNLPGLQFLLDFIGKLSADDGHQTDSHIEHAEHFCIIDVPQ